MQNAHYYNEKYNLLHTRNTYYTRDYTKLRPSDKPTQYEKTFITYSCYNFVTCANMDI